MNAIIEFLNSSWLHALGYTLLHSLWQAGLILSLVTIALKFIPTKLSNARYAITSISMLFILMLSVGTFFYIYFAPKGLPSTIELSSTDQSQHAANAGTSVLGVDLYSAKSLIHSNMPFFLMLWISGTIIFCLRILTGLLYIGKLRERSVLIHGEWSLRVQSLADQLQIHRWVSLGESKHIQIPIVIGYLKPIILIPVGMCSNLSTDQLEAIFLHELMHIRRKDYLINVIQSFLEAIFFFNPFVWIISGMMKKEREHCCDDAVVQHHGNPMAYARALTSLEEVRLSKTGLSLSLAENKNQLLNRIKRLMETSVKNYSGRERIIPALLLVIGLICASWLSVQTGRNESLFYQTNNQTVVSDTTKKDKKTKKIKKAKTASTNETSLLNEDEKSEQPVGQEPDADDDMTEEYSGPMPFDLPSPPDAPPFPDVDIGIPPFPDFNLIPNDFNEKEWQEFGKAFEEKFRAKFGDFYQTHEKEIQRIMEEAQEKVNKFDEDWAVKMQDLARKQEAWARTHADQWERQADLLSRQEEQLKNSEENVKRWEERQSLHREEFEKRQKQLEKKMKAFEQNTKQFEEELRNELIKDGYLDKDEKLTNMHWHNGSIEINGKKIKVSDEKKYNELHEKYFKEPKEEVSEKLSKIDP